MSLSSWAEVGQHALEAFLILALAILAARIARSVVGRATRRLPAMFGIVLARVVFVGLLLLGLLGFLSVLFGNGNVAVTGVIAASIVASFGVQDLLRNYVSGLYLLFEGNLKVGDSIQFDGVKGKVEQVRARVTYLRGTGGDLVVVPNAELFNRVVIIHPRKGEGPPEAGL